MFFCRRHRGLFCFRYFFAFNSWETARQQSLTQPWNNRKCNRGEIMEQLLVSHENDLLYLQMAALKDFLARDAAPLLDKRQRATPAINTTASVKTHWQKKHLVMSGSFQKYSASLQHQ